MRSGGKAGVLVAIFAIAISLFSQARANHAQDGTHFPDPGIGAEIGNPENQFVMVSRVGSGNTLDATLAYYSLAIPETSNSLRVDIKDGAYHSEGNSDPNTDADPDNPSAPSCGDSAARRRNENQVEFQLVGSGDTILAGRTVNSSSMPCNDWYRFEIRLNELSPAQADALTRRSGYFRPKLKVKFRQRYIYNAAVNAFKLRVPAGNYVGFAEEGGRAGSENELLRPFAAQNRKSPAGSLDRFVFKFKPDCFQSEEQTRSLRWNDADAQGGSPPNPQLRMWLEDVTNGKLNEGGERVWLRRGSSNQQILSGAELGGNDVEMRWEFTARPGHLYRWVWDDVLRENGLQVWTPYDSVEYYMTCPTTTPPEGDCTIIEPADGFTPTGSTFNSRIRVRNRGSQNWPTSDNYRLRPTDTTARKFNVSEVRLPLIRAGGSHTESITATTPTVAGRHRYHWKVIRGPNNREVANCSITIRVPGGAIYGANWIEMAENLVRDNFDIGVRVMSYLWPDAGLLGRDDSGRFWLAGIYRDSGGARDPNTLSKFNYQAEQGCPGGGSCSEIIPMAYVNADDGSGQRNTSTKDGSRTPNGNLWHSIREELAGGSYVSFLGGIWSRDNSDVGGSRGNHINNVEVSNIRVEAANPQPAHEIAWQGGVDQSTFQQDVPSYPEPLKLPAGSQGPVENGVGMAGHWDNLRNNPRNSSPGTVDFANTGGSPSNFTDDPASMLSVYRSRTRSVANLTATSLLQDGKDRDHNPQYQRPTEPLSYTGSFGSGDLRLKWDEYSDWTQVDDKGHYYPTQQQRATGVDRGSPQTQNVTLYHVNQGYQTSFNHVHEENHTHYSNHTHTSCTGSGRRRRCTSFNHVHTSNHVHYTNHTHYTSCTGSYPTSIGYNYSSPTYYTQRSETQFGWLNTDSNITGTVAGRPSYFAGYESGVPPWARRTGFWQDTNVTGMSNSGSTAKPAHGQRWILDRGDPLYNNRQMFTQATQTPQFATSAYATNHRCIYPNGSASSYTQSATVYSNWRYLYEDSTNPSGVVYGRYNFTEDGRKDGYVDTGWQWASNKQRVRYEQTFNGRHRKLGNYTYDSITGLDEGTMKPARGVATIGNPRVELRDGDVFSAGNLHSYFEGSNTSAFLFSNGSIINVDPGTARFENYFNNPDLNRVNLCFEQGSRSASDCYRATPDPARSVFKRLDADLLGHAQTRAITSATLAGNFDLGASPNRVWRRGTAASRQNLTLNDVNFCNGAGTIVVTGDLIINGNVGYCGYNGSARAQLPSVGFIVLGRISVNGGVRSVSGAYFTNCSFDSGSTISVGNLVGGSCGSVASTGSSRSGGDPDFTLRGLIVARNFYLRRQPRQGGLAEQFIYDGRIVVNTPPGFTELYSAPAAWNEGVPSN